MSEADIRDNAWFDWAEVAGFSLRKEPEREAFETGWDAREQEVTDLRKQLAEVQATVAEVAELASTSGIDVGTLSDDSDVQGMGMCVSRDEILSVLRNGPGGVRQAHLDALVEARAEVTANRVVFDKVRRARAAVESGGPGKHESWDTYHEGRLDFAREVEGIVNTAPSAAAADYCPIHDSPICSPRLNDCSRLTNMTPGAATKGRGNE